MAVFSLSVNDLKELNKLTLELFNCVINVYEQVEEQDIEVIHLRDNLFITQNAEYAKDTISEYSDEKYPKTSDLLKSFYKNWETVQNLTTKQRFIDQILHYITAYNKELFNNNTYIPVDRSVKLEDVKDPVMVKVFTARSVNEIKESCIKMLNSGIALKQETIEDLFRILVCFKVDGAICEQFKNKEAMCLWASKGYGFPNDAVEFIRYLVYQATKSTLLINDKKTRQAIVDSNMDIERDLIRFGVNKLAEVFNRFSDIFLSFKLAHDKNKSIINKISKLSKSKHKPMFQNPFNRASSVSLKEHMGTKLCEGTTTFALLKILRFLEKEFLLGTKVHNDKDFELVNMYRIRNGKMFVKSDREKTPKGNTGKTNESVLIEALKKAGVDAKLLPGMDKSKPKSVKDKYTKERMELIKQNYLLILGEIKNRVSKLDVFSKKLYIPEGVEYGYPTTEKMFLGNVPFGTKIKVDKDDGIAVGIYWHTKDGARDIDLSSISVQGKIGWNAAIKDANGTLMYSGDVVDATTGATEWLYCTGSKSLVPQLVKINLFNGSGHTYKFKVMVGKYTSNEKIHNHRDDGFKCVVPDELVSVNEIEKECEDDRSALLGFIYQEENKLVYEYSNLKGKSESVCSATQKDLDVLSSICLESELMSFNSLLVLLGYVVTDTLDEECINLSTELLERDSLMNLLV